VAANELPVRQQQRSGPDERELGCSQYLVRRPPSSRAGDPTATGHASLNALTSALRGVALIASDRTIFAVRLGSDGVEREAADVHWTSSEDVADEHETERGSSGVSLLSEIVEVKVRNFGKFLVDVYVEWAELLLEGRGWYVFAGPAVQPVRPTVVGDCGLVGDPFDRDAHDPAFEQARERDAESSASLDQVNRVKRREVDRVTPRHTKMGHLPLEDGLAPIPLGPLSVVHVGMSVAEIVERQQVSAPEVICAQMVDEGHPRIVSVTAPTRAPERHIGAGWLTPLTTCSAAAGAALDLPARSTPPPAHDAGSGAPERHLGCAE
jgi:hypothetical protein